MSDETAKRDETMSEKFERHAKMARAAFGDDYRGRCIIEDICRWIAAQERQREERDKPA